MARPIKKVIVEETVTEGNVAVAEVDADNDDNIELGDLVGINIEGATQRIQAKHKKDHHIAWVQHEDARMAHNRWKYLKFVNGGTDVAECTFEEAEKRKAFLVLCWRKRKFQDMIDAEIRRRNVESMKRASVSVKERASSEIQNLGFRDKLKISDDSEN